MREWWMEMESNMEKRMVWVRVALSRQICVPNTTNNNKVGGWGCVDLKRRERHIFYQIWIWKNTKYLYWGKRWFVQNVMSVKVTLLAKYLLREHSWIKYKKWQILGGDEKF